MLHKLIVPRCTLFVLLTLLIGSGNASTSSEAEGPHLNKVISKLERGEMVTGIWVFKPTITNALGLLGYNNYPNREESLTKPMIDFAIVTMEHGAYDVEQVQQFLLGLSSTREALVRGDPQPSIATLVRIPADGDQPVHAMIKQVLDMGAYGVIVPHVRTAAEARRVVQACRYPQPTDSLYPEPAGRRGAAPLRAAHAWGVTPDTYLRHADVWPLNPNGAVLAGIMIEDREGVDNIEEIVAVPGLGVVMFGPSDYSFATGGFGESTPAVDAAREKVRRASMEAGVPFIDFANGDNIQEKLDQDQNMLLIGSDLMGGAYHVHRVHQYLRQRSGQ